MLLTHGVDVIITFSHRQGVTRTCKNLIRVAYNENSKHKTY